MTIFIANKSCISLCAALLFVKYDSIHFHNQDHVFQSEYVLFTQANTNSHQVFVLTDKTSLTYEALVDENTQTQIRNYQKQITIRQWLFFWKSLLTGLAWALTTGTSSRLAPKQVARRVNSAISKQHWYWIKLGLGSSRNAKIFNACSQLIHYETWQFPGQECEHKLQTLVLLTKDCKRPFKAIRLHPGMKPGEATAGYSSLKQRAI